MRVLVRPAVAGATILDPTRGRDLPAEGAEVELSAYWIGLANRGDVIVEELQPEQEAEPEVSRGP